jgi:PIN domain nuclease of toxin-antitoxin system
MRLLLDTHVFLWYITGDTRLPATFRDAVQNSSNEAFLTPASVWEAVLKYSLGKLPLPAPPAEFLPRQREAHRILALPIDEGAFIHLAAIPLLHRDPFDRILIAQSMQHGLALASADDVVRQYPVPHLPLR